MIRLRYPPILTYHRVHLDPASDTPAMAPEVFERQMAILSKYWKPIPLSGLVSCLEDGAAFPARSVVVTFDDGTEDTFAYAFPILKSYQIPATVFLIAANVGRDSFLKPEQIHRMRESGVTFGSHTTNHAYLPSLPMSKVWEEVIGSKRALEGLGLAVDTISYPAGGFTPQIQEMVRKAGYRAACTTNRGVQRFQIDRWAVRRISMHGKTTSFLGLWLRCSGYYGFTRSLKSPA